VSTNTRLGVGNTAHRGPGSAAVIPTAPARRSEGGPATGLSLEAGASGRYDYGGQLAHLLAMAGLYAACLILGATADARVLLNVLMPSGLVVICVSLFLGLRVRDRGAPIVACLLDMVWILAAMALTRGLQGFLLLPLLLVAMAAMVRGDPREATLIAGVGVVGLIGLAGMGLDGITPAVGLAQVAVFAATTAAARMIPGLGRCARAHDWAVSAEAHEALRTAVSDAVFEVSPADFMVTDCNPAAVALFAGSTTDGNLVGLALDKVLGCNDVGFVGRCQQRLNEEGAVHAATTTALSGNREPRTLVLDLMPMRANGHPAYIQVVVRATADEDDGASGRNSWPDYDFVSHYIPPLTHELNNHLGAIRLSAELADVSGVMPDVKAIQEEVDHCQQVLQTVVTQILRASAPVSANPDIAPVSDLGQVIENALLLAQPQILSQGIQLQLNLPPGQMPSVSGHAHELQEALVRIILHATRALRENAPPRPLSCHVTLREGEVSIAFTHGGKGLTWGEMAALNGQSAVVPRGEQRTWTVVREGITRFGGTLTAANSIAGGTRFRITLKTAEKPVEGVAHGQASFA
jgi:signal transduction histidine kinase